MQGHERPQHSFGVSRADVRPDPPNADATAFWIGPCSACEPKVRCHLIYSASSGRNPRREVLSR